MADITAEQRENYKLWIQALRSGEYNQGRNFLSDSDRSTYCCLGVACVLFGERIGNQQALPRKGAGAFQALGDCEPDVLYKGRKTGVVTLNDEVQLTFEEIADLLEKEYVND